VGPWRAGRAFTEAAGGFRGEVRWITFNGKRFDVPFLEARASAHGLSPPRADMRNTYPYSHAPHADLMTLWPFHYGLAGLCELLGVASPKGPMNGSDVAGAVAAGEVAQVARYCERDVVATLACARAARGLLGL
jgi:predicted PolB exonuclease-like 3'-5' exonuclease